MITDMVFGFKHLNPPLKHMHLDQDSQYPLLGFRQVQAESTSKGSRKDLRSEVFAEKKPGLRS